MMKSKASLVTCTVTYFRIMVATKESHMNNYHDKNVMHVKCVTLRVRAIEKMLDFYTNVLGMKILDQATNRYRLGTESGRVLVILIVDEKAKKAAITTGLFHLALLLPTRHDLGVFLNYLLAIDYPLAGASNHDVSEALYLVDPEGNGIEVYADLPTEDWKFTRNGIYMTTVAIDHVSLLKEIGDYEKIPDDTVIGHLHLRVNNIESAHKFFVEILGFQKSLDYGPTASFVSDGKYHHHLAYNTWGGTTNPNLKDYQLGLVTYEINLPADRKDKLLESLGKSKIAYTQENNRIHVEDINGVKITLSHH